MGFNLQDKTKITVKDVTFENNDDYVDFHIQRSGKRFAKCYPCLWLR